MKEKIYKYFYRCDLMYLGYAIAFKTKFPLHNSTEIINFALEKKILKKKEQADFVTSTKKISFDEYKKFKKNLLVLK